MSSITDEEWESLLLQGNVIEHRNQQRKRSTSKKPAHARKQTVLKRASFPHLCREFVVNMLRLLIPTLTRQIASEYGLKQDDFQCQIVPFGSYGLGANLVDSDIDVMFLGAWEVRRRDFFRIFPSILKEQATIQYVEVGERVLYVLGCGVELDARSNLSDRGKCSCAHHQMHH